MRTVEECYEYVIARRNELAAQRRKRRAVVLKIAVPVCGLLVIVGGIFVVRYDKAGISNSSHFVENSTTNIEGASLSSTTDENHILPQTDDLPIFVYGFADVNVFPDFFVTSDNLQQISSMDSREMFEYYGIEELVANLANAGFVENTDTDTQYGIYTLPDSSVVDYNTFHFTSSSNGMEITVCAGKDFKFGQDYYDEFDITPIGKTNVYIYRCVDEDVYFALFRYGDCSMMVFATASLIDVDENKAEGALFFKTLKIMLGEQQELRTEHDSSS